VRVYLPATLPLLAQWLAAGEAVPAAIIAGGDAADTPAYAVTPVLREWYFDGDAEELEHAAQRAAAHGSLALLALDSQAPRRRAVLAVDVDDADARPAPTLGRAAVTLAGPVPRSRWASALLDEAETADVVAAAITALGPAAAGDGDAQFDLDEADAHDLGWYAVQELPHLQ
jgi:hypothetical protein